MKQLILSCVAAGLMSASSAFAISTVTFTDGPGSTGGGEFNATTSDNGNFVTFCLQYNEHISLGGQFYYEISTTTKPGTPDPISKATAWLYNEFLNGTLTGYSHTTTEANRLQKAIWWLEDEATGAGQIAANQEANNYVIAALNATGANGKTEAANGAYGVYVMNVWSSYDSPNGTYSGAKQDQLIRIPVPDGGTTLALLGMSMGFVAYASRRIRK